MIETATSNELDLLKRVKDARQRCAEIDEAKKKADGELDEAEGKLIGFMADMGIKSTAKYEGIGFASLDKPELFARCNKPDQEKLIAYLKDNGRADLIKPSIHHKSLSGYVGELLESGGNIPEFIQYGFKQTLKVYKA